MYKSMCNVFVLLCLFGQTIVHQLVVADVNEASLLANKRVDKLNALNGIDTLIFDFPWQVSIQDGNEHICGGAIYMNAIIVTAAHCVHGKDINNLTVRAGSSQWHVGGTLVQIEKIICHQQYAPQTNDNDIALVRVSAPFVYSSTMQPISLADKTPANNMNATVSGWAHITATDNVLSQLKFINTKIIARDVCASSKYDYGKTVLPSMFCASDPNMNGCQYDMGGPLIANGRLIGIVSSDKACLKFEYPVIYTDIAYFRDWINDTSQII